MSAVDTIAGAAETRGTAESRQRHCCSGDTTSWYERRWPWWHDTASSRPEQQLHAVGKTWPRLIRAAATFILWHCCTTARLSRYNNKQRRRWPCCWDAALVHRCFVGRRRRHPFKPRWMPDVSVRQRGTRGRACVARRRVVSMRPGLIALR